MSIDTRSKFYYDFTVEDSANEIPFNEGGSELTASLRVLPYTPTGLAVEIARAMTEAGGNDYSSSFDRVSRIFTITSLGTDFEIMGASGTSLSSALSFLGFDAVDTGLASSHAGVNTVGKVYRPQFLLQSYVDFEDDEGAVSGVRRDTASGGVEAVTFGTKSICEFNIEYITNQEQSFNSPIENNPTGLEDARDFLRYATTLRPFEFMKNRDNVASFEEVLLEKTQIDRNGLRYRLYELYTRGVPNYYETKTITLRKI